MAMVSYCTEAAEPDYLVRLALAVG
jgi:hypothetical protein